MPGKPDHPHIQAEVLAAELGADPEVLGHLQDALFHVPVSESLSFLISFVRKSIEIPCSGEFYGFEVGLRRSPAHHKSEVVGRARCGAKGFHFVRHESAQGFRVQHRPGFLEEKGLVRRASSFGDEEKLVGLAFCGVKINLSRKVAPRVFLLVHG